MEQTETDRCEEAGAISTSTRGRSGTAPKMPGDWPEISSCRLCGHGGLDEVFSLGVMANASVFPRTADEEVESGPLTLVKCGDCGLVQLDQRYGRGAIDAGCYGYRSGLNPAMVKHLGEVAQLAMREHPKARSVLDIGANDGTLLGAFPAHWRRAGVEPNAEQFQEHYPAGVEVHSGYFDGHVGRRSDIITTIAMLYDLDDPLEFARGIYRCLAPGGVWVTEQSYLPTMLKRGAYDTICHEHLTYFGLEQLAWLAERAGFKITHCRRTETNGGSMLAVLRKGRGLYEAWEERRETDAAAFKAFGERVEQRRLDLLSALEKFDVVHGLGASTKGNIILQYCRPELACIAEVNPDKFGRFTPGTRIPIVDEREAAEPDAWLVLPWHFRRAMVERYPDATLIFPLG